MKRTRQAAPPLAGADTRSASLITHIALVRGINVGGHKQIAMADLRALVTGLGLADARSLLQSGNLVFACEKRTCLQLERLLESELQRRLEMACDVFVRTAEEWASIVGRNPFRAEAQRDPGRLIVTFFRGAPAARAVKALQDSISGPETLRVVGRQAYTVYPTGIGTSKLTHAAVEKSLGTRGTGRNWNTVLKLAAAATG